MMNPKMVKTWSQLTAAEKAPEARRVPPEERGVLHVRRSDEGGNATKHMVFFRCRRQ
jgi:hypothetical protein